MAKKTLIVGIVGASALVAAALVYFNGGAGHSALAFISPSNTALVARGKTVYASQCASCHGVNLEGQAEWRKRMPNGRLPAPPHDVSGHTWHHPDAVLVDIVKNGLVAGKTAPRGYESDMPAYGKILSDDDIAAVLAYIKSTWPSDALQIQKDMTLQQGQK